MLTVHEDKAAADSKSLTGLQQSTHASGCVDSQSAETDLEPEDDHQWPATGLSHSDSSQALEPLDPELAACVGGTHLGTLCFVDEEGSYGHIRCSSVKLPSGGDIFVPGTELAKLGERSCDLHTGHRVSFGLALSGEGAPEAVDVALVGRCDKRSTNGSLYAYSSGGSASSRMRAPQFTILAIHIARTMQRHHIIPCHKTGRGHHPHNFVMSYKTALLMK